MEKDDGRVPTEPGSQASPGAAEASPPSGFDPSRVYRSEGYEMWLDHVPDAQGDPTVEQWRFRLDETEGSDGHGWLELTVHEIVPTEHSGTLAVYYRQWFAPDGEPAWGNRRKRVVGSLGSLKALMRRRKMTASGIAARSDEIAQQAQPEGREPGPSGDAQDHEPGDNNARGT